MQGAAEQRTEPYPKYGEGAAQAATQQHVASDGSMPGFAGQQDGTVCRLLSNVVASSMDLHVQYGGVVPEIAARSHIEVINGVIQQALEEADCAWGDIDAIAVTYGAGLGGSLLIGVLTARTLAITHHKPLYAINHVEGHVYANFLTEVKKLPEHSEGTSEQRVGEWRLPMSEATSVPQEGEDSQWLAARQSAGQAVPADKQLRGRRMGLAPLSIKQSSSIADYRLPKTQPAFPALALIVSGGHSQLVLFRDHFDYTLLGQTHDDAVGEAFDKVAKIIGLPYPGGVSISQLAPSGNAHAYTFPKAKMTSVSPELQELRDREREARSEKRELRQNTVLRSNSQKVAKGDIDSTHTSYLIPHDSAATSCGSYDFSFSGLKTAVLRTAQDAIGEDFTFPSKDISARLSPGQQADIAASFNRIAIETVVDKTILAYEEFRPKSVIIAGGVAASPELRRQLAERLPIPIEYTDHRLCTDNGAMIATLGCFHMKYGRPAADPYTLDIAPNLSM